LTVRQSQGNLSAYLQQANGMTAKTFPFISIETTLAEPISPVRNDSLNERMNPHGG